MSLVIPQGFAHVIHSLMLSGDVQPMAITYGVEVSVLATDATDVANACESAFDNVVTAMNAAYSMVQTEVTYQDSPLPAPPTIGVNTDTTTGAGSGGVVPQNTAFLIHKRGPVGGRGGKGRFYLPGVNEGAVNNSGQVDPTNLAAWQTVMNTFLTDLVATDEVIQMVVLHDSTGAFAAADPAPVTSLVVDPVVSTQRRRLRP